MKILPMIIVLFLIQVGITVFDNSYNTDDYTLNPYNQSYYDINGTSQGTQEIWNVMVNPIDYWYSSDGFFLKMVSILGVATVIVIGIYFFTKSETILLAPIAIIIAGFGFIPIANLYLIIQREVGYYACSVGETCSPAIILTMLIVSPLVVAWIFAVLEFWTSRQTS